MKKIIIIIISIFLLFGIWQTTQGVELILKGQYPPIEVEGKQYLPTTGGLPGFIRYLYLFALGAAGIVALLAILIGAIMYIFSAGNPSKAADAKDRILSAILGIIILLSAVLILNIINPNLVNIGFALLPIQGAEEIPSEARACFCRGEFEICYENGPTCLDFCTGYCQVKYPFSPLPGICNIDANHCP